MSKGAVDAFGTDFMESLNAAGGGNNRPKKSSGTIYAAGGGQIGARIGVLDMVVPKEDLKDNHHLKELHLKENPQQIITSWRITWNTIT